MKELNRVIAITLVYLLGLIQGIAFTTIPAAANFLTDETGFGFTEAEYGSIFIPMILGAIIASFAGGLLGKRYTVKRVLLAGVALSAASMALFASTEMLDTRYSAMLGTMLLLGTGFGANITALNPLAIHFFPQKGSAAVTALHSCLGIGTAIGPLLWVFYQGRHMWWADPAFLSGIFFILLIIGFFFLPKSAQLDDSGSENGTNRALAVGTFVLIAFLYGIIETTYGNWSTIYFHHVKKLSAAEANTLLSLFWGSVTAGRILATLLSLVIPPAWIFRVIPLLILTSAVAITFATGFDPSAIVMIIAGLGCSAFLPLTVSFGVQNLKSNPAFASGLIIGTYMVGYGVAAEGIGLLHKREEVPFESLFLAVAALAIFLFLLNGISTWKIRRQG